MVELTSEQQQAVRASPNRPLRMVDPASRQTFVLLTEEQYETLRARDYDDSPWTALEMELLQQEAVDQLGWEGMEAYQDDKR